MRTIFFASMLALLTPTLAQAADRFDLKCHVVRAEQDENGQHSVGYDVRFSIDLAKNQFCEQVCKDGPDEIKSVSPTEIVLYDVRNDLGSRHEKINRMTGKYTKDFDIAGADSEAEGDCVVAPFTPFPATKF